MRKYYWYISTFFKKHGLVVAASIVVAIIVFSLFLPFVLKILDFKKTTYIGVVGGYTLDNLPRNIQDEISDGLTQIQPDGSVQTSLAERWTTEDDGKTYRFLIKKNIYWQDGKLVTPSDFTYDFNKVQILTNANEVIFKLPNAFSPFPSVVSKPLLRVVEEPYFFFFKKRKIIGIGDFQVNDFQEKGQRLSELTISNLNEKHVYRFYLTEDDAIAAFKRGEVDVVSDLTSADSVKDWLNVSVTKTLDDNTYLGVFFNTTNDFFASNEIRQALNYALMKPTDETRAVGPISPKSWAFSNVGKTYDYDEARAIDRILAQIPGTPIHFDLTTTPNFADEANSIKKQWENFGQDAFTHCQSSSMVKDKSTCANLKIHVNIRISNFPDTSNFQALLIGEQSPSDPDQYSLWHSDQPTNFTQYKNVRIDSLLEKGRQTQDQKLRFQIYQDFQEFFSEDAPVIFIRHLDKYEVSRKGV